MKKIRVLVGLALGIVMIGGSIRICNELWLNEFTSTKATVHEQRVVGSESERTAMVDKIIEYNQELDKLKFLQAYLPKVLFPSEISEIERIIN